MPTSVDYSQKSFNLFTKRCFHHLVRVMSQEVPHSKFLAPVQFTRYTTRKRSVISINDLACINSKAESWCTAPWGFREVQPQ